MIKLGRHSYCYGEQRGIANDVIIGNFSSIAQGVIFDGGFNHYSSYVSTFPFSKIWSELPSNINCKGDINIGNDVWIGEDTIIMGGVTIADGCIIGARSIVTKNIVRPYTIHVGMPCMFKKDRFIFDQRIELSKIKWWNWPDEKIKENAHLLNSENIQEFITKHYTP